MKNKIDLTYSGKLRASINVVEDKILEVNYTVDGESGKPTTTSILIKEGEEFLMITFNYQELKRLVDDKNEKI